MARLPDIAGESQQPTPQPTGGVAAYEPPNWRQVGMAGQVISGAGRDLEEAANTVAATNERQDSLVAQSAANVLQQQRITQEFDPQAGFRNAKEGQAVGQQFVDTYGQKFTDAATSIRDGLSNENQKRIFDQHAQVQGLQFKSALLAHQSQETEKFNDSTADSSIKLALSTMAQKPTDELNFQTGLAQINGTLEATAKRKGMPPEQLTNLKATYLDAAYSTRITSIMDGIPGVAPANPYAAEKMFKQVQDRLGPASQVHLANQVQKSVQSVQARDTAQSFIFGRPSTAPATIAPAIGDTPPLQAVVQQMESGGNPNAVSSKGATSEMQVMPATSDNPGFGVRPAQLGADGKPLEGEVARVGRDYLGAMTARYDNPALVMAAYNAGPGQVDKWLAKFGDPRAGQISTQDWVAKIPFDETKNYVTNGLQKLGTQTAPSQPPTANQLKADLYARVQSARQVAEQQYPGDTAYADAVAARTENYGRMVISNQQGIQAAAHDSLISGTLGSKPDGSDKPLTVDQLLADPAMKRAWDQATPEVKSAIQDRFARGEKNNLTQDGANLYYGLLGKAGTDPQSFTQEDLSTYFGKMPDHLLLGLMAAQKSINTKDAAQNDKALNWGQAKSNVEDMLKPIGLGLSAKANSTNAKTSEQFYGRLQESMETYKAQNGKWPQAQDVRKMAASLLTEGAQKGGWIWDSKTRAFQADQSQFYVPLPSAKSAEYSQLNGAFTKVMGRPATQAELQQWYTAYKLSGAK